jgi:hypothetical protein
VTSVTQSFRLHDVDDIWAIELPLEFVVVSTPVHTISNRADQGLVDDEFC